MPTSDPSGGKRTDVEQPQAFALLDEHNDERTRKEAVETLGNPSNSMPGSERRIVDRLIEVALTDESVAVRAEAINSLYFHGDRYLEEFVSGVAARTRREDTERAAEDVFGRWLTSDHAEYRMAGATALSGVGSEQSLGALRRALDDGDPRVRARSARAYAESGGETVERLQPLLQTRNDLVRRAAVDALVTIGSSEATALLSTAATGGTDRLRRLVVKRLYELDRHESAVALLRAMRDPSNAVRYSATVSLLRLLAEGEAVRAEAVRKRLVTETDLAFERDGKKGDDGGKSDDERWAIGRLLHEIVSGDHTDNATAETERYAAWVLGELAAERGGDGTVAAWLLDALDHGDSLVADLAAAYLSQIDAPSVERELRSIAADDEARSDTRDRARSVLRRLKRRTAASAVDRSIEYVYVRWPADYTEKHEG